MADVSLEARESRHVCEAMFAALFMSAVELDPNETGSCFRQSKGLGVSSPRKIRSRRAFDEVAKIAVPRAELMQITTTTFRSQPVTSLGLS